uniref:Toxin CcTX-1 (Fragments) n=1 Tax=Cyanea capillata TaxID=27804 RepID=JTXU1_CYACP|nr:RecName: Full=Toxin CcTX-1 [Cyanea capillata]
SSPEKKNDMSKPGRMRFDNKKEPRSSAKNSGNGYGCVDVNAGREPLTGPGKYPSSFLLLLEHRKPPDKDRDRWDNVKGCERKDGKSHWYDSMLKHRSPREKTLVGSGKDSTNFVYRLLTEPLLNERAGCKVVDMWYSLSYWMDVVNKRFGLCHYLGSMMDHGRWNDYSLCKDSYAGKHKPAGGPPTPRLKNREECKFYWCWSGSEERAGGMGREYVMHSGGLYGDLTDKRDDPEPNGNLEGGV